MTPSEIEAELESLRAQLSQLRAQQDTRAAAWSSIIVQCWGLALLLFVTSAVIFSIGVWFNNSGVTPLGAVIFLQIFTVMLLARALGSAAAKSP